MEKVIGSENQLQTNKIQFYEYLLSFQIPKEEIDIFYDLHSQEIKQISSKQQLTQWIDKFLKERIQKNLEMEANICAICLQNLLNSEVKLMCNHKTCKNCIQAYLSNLINMKKIQNIKCPIQFCQSIIKRDQIKLNISDNQFQKFQKFQRFVLLSKNQNLRWCSNPHCNLYVIRNNSQEKLRCECGQQICFKCGQTWHTNTCEEELKNQCGKMIEDLKLQKCPKCGLLLQKLEGCNHMKCTKCYYQFCWLCLRQYTLDHYKWWNIAFGCPKQQNSQNYWIGWNYLLVIFSVPIFFILLFLFITASILIGIVMGFIVPFLLAWKFQTQKMKFTGCIRILFWIIALLVIIIILPFSLVLGIVPGSCLMMRDFARQNF